MSDTVRQVSRYEANLLGLVAFILRQTHAEQGLGLVRNTMPEPKCLSADAVALVQDRLSKGAILLLVRGGAWRRERFLREGQPVGGSAWQRHPLDELALEFSEASLKWLMWLTSQRPHPGSKAASPKDSMPRTAGDELLLFWIYEALRQSHYDLQSRAKEDFVGGLREHKAFATNALVRLAYAGDFVAAVHRDQIPDYAPWMKGPRAAIVEMLQGTLERAWVNEERRKGGIHDVTLFQRLGPSQEEILVAFLAACEAAGRYDLARFVLRSLSRVLSRPGMPLTFWTGGMNFPAATRLSDRLEAQRGALALLRQATCLQYWERQARGRSFFDDDYAAAKWWLGEWEESAGNEVARRAEAVIQQTNPLRFGDD